MYSFSTALMEEELLSLVPGPSLTGAPQLINLAVPEGANNAPLLVLRLVFTNGGTGNDLQTLIDNIQVNGTIFPSQSTAIAGRGITSLEYPLATRGCSFCA